MDSPVCAFRVSTATCTSFNIGCIKHVVHRTCILFTAILLLQATEQSTLHHSTTATLLIRFGNDTVVDQPNTGLSRTKESDKSSLQTILIVVAVLALVIIVTLILVVVFVLFHRRDIGIVTDGKKRQEMFDVPYVVDVKRVPV